MITGLKEGGFTPGQQFDLATVIGAPVLIAVASTEAGYLGGRIAAWLFGMRTAPTT
jgi:hypothetical protein